MSAVFWRGKPVDAADFAEHAPVVLRQIRLAARTAAADRICGSPWLGRTYIERANGGRGPLWEGYRHCYADEELHDVALRDGLLWQRRDLNQHHDHWQRRGIPRPAYLAHVQKQWRSDRALFEERKAAGFPGSEVLP